MRWCSRGRLGCDMRRVSGGAQWLIAVLALSAIAAAAQTQPAEKTSGPVPSPNFHIRGIVKSGNSPLPGVTVTAANTLTGKKAVTSTEVDGSYLLELGGRGRYVVRAEMTAFAPATQEVVLNASSPEQQANFSLVLLSRAPKPEQPASGQSTAAGALARDGRGTQRLGLSVDDSGLLAAGSAEAGSSGEQPALGGLAGLANSPDATNQSVTFAGQLGNTQSFLGGIRTSDELRDRMQQLGAQGGGPFGQGPGVGSPLGAALGGGPFATRRNRLDINQPHGTLYYSAGNSLFDASSYSLNGQGGNNPGYNSSRFGGLIGGPLKIPHIIENNKTFIFGGYTGTRATTPYIAYSTVPTQAEIQNAAALLPSTNPIALQILNNFIPAPTSAGQALNYRYATSADNNSDNLFLRLTHNFGDSAPRPFGGGRPGGRRSRNNLNFNFNWLRNDSSQLTPFPTASGTNGTSSFNTGLGWAAGKGNWNNTLRVNFNRARVDVTNLYAGNEQPVEIPGISTNPLDWGLPNISIKGFTPLTDIAPQYRNDATLQFSETAIWNKHKHNVRFGTDYRRLWTTLRSNADPRGTFTFTGFDTGNALADFLAGMPQSTALQYSATPYFFSTNSYDFFVQDDWRVRSNFTFQIGLRYEYIAPYTEANNQLANLDVVLAPGLTAVTCVTPTQIGQCTAAGSASLMKPDRDNFAPRVGFAWKVEKNTVVRGGYGINYNLSQYGTIITQLAYQPPFAVALTPIATTPGALTFANAFPTAAGITNNYGVDPNYRLAYVQLWNLNIQHAFGTSLLVNVGYNGSKGTDLDTMTAPNRTPSGLLLPNVGAFNYETSQGSSILHAGTLRVRKRLAHGLAIGGTYVYSKSIDDASSIGGGAVVVAQNPLNLSAERGLSSFDQRHNFTGDFLYELPFGTGKRWLSAAGPTARVFGDWTVSGSFTIASGTPFTVYLLDNISDVARGSNGSLRPNLVPGQSIQLANPGISEWFNTNAFIAPPPGQYGDAGRNIVIGPGTILFNMSAAKTFPFHETKSLEFRATANNVFNHPNYSGIDTNMNSPTFGQVTSVASMRQLQFLSRFRF
ncbi:MAG: TonB-dependent receptor [Candidatus Korobacteraceae bacterium]